MRQSSAYINNNEALACVALGYLLKGFSSITSAKALLVLPFILHYPTVRKLRSSSLKRSLEEFIVKNPECFISFNARFVDYLPLSINAITILSEMNIITIRRDEIVYNYTSDFSPEYSRTIGKRATDFLPAIEVLAYLFKGQNENSLYLKLKIEL
ncbi:three component ABC system middle component [Pedobacter sp. P351]|uniref:three component ABC system middle component n=1 Tax=Pedobacter superstes TaxID=3133441 RepID=UPI0030A74FC7